MSIAKSYILNHVRHYFLDRLNNHNGICFSGWGVRQDRAKRCALGSIVPYLPASNMQSVGDAFRKLVEENIYYKEFDNFFYLIESFNDDHSYAANPLTIQNIDRFLLNLAKINKLYYNLISKEDEVSNVI